MAKKIKKEILNLSVDPQWKQRAKDASFASGISISELASRVFEYGFPLFEREELPDLIQEHRSKLEEFLRLAQAGELDIPVTVAAPAEGETSEEAWKRVEENDDVLTEFEQLAPTGGRKTILGRFRVTGKPDQLHRCSGACGRTLGFRSFPTDDAGEASGIRVSECRTCAIDRRSENSAN